MTQRFIAKVKTEDGEYYVCDAHTGHISAVEDPLLASEFDTHQAAFSAVKKYVKGWREDHGIFVCKSHLTQEMVTDEARKVREYLTNALEALNRSFEAFEASPENDATRRAFINTIQKLHNYCDPDES